MRKTAGWIILLFASWMMVAPQAPMGLKELKWMYDYAFSGQVLLGIVLMAIAYYLLDFKPGKTGRA